MTAQGEDILAWTEHAITAREEAANAAPRSPWSVLVDDDALIAPDGIPVVEAFALSGQQTRAILNHVALHDPASVLRRCAADRKILHLHGGRGHSCSAIDADGDLDEHARFYDHEVCDTVRALAEGYGWTEGER
ncbi:hypothetical protein TPA0910_86870 [Streptomyces hygroscopicus subsp. sporocinereus]|uniref:Uncharacterized protein n=1 Tax=Streptomyces hygroscopicus TaxID=1912 RepID=A0ABQ3UF73_STRHY|nr:DUF6221 family protein [Streptomyces hygroscopicus]GHJ34254.1 hypothetical protein TPA0910_86870 [Streptomyces hygroscopicus]